MSLLRWFSQQVINWLSYEMPVEESFLCNFEQLSYEIRPGDVLLVEGRSRISEVIRTITQSRWTHSAIYIGRIHEIKEESLRTLIESHYQGDPGEQLIIEALLGHGTIISPLSVYKGEHLRICHPNGLSPHDALKVISHALMQLGKGYDIRQLLDLGRFLLPWSLFPRRWRSTLFGHNAGSSTRSVCSSMLASAFASVHYPILPVIRIEGDGELHFYKRNSRLFTPSDFDYSPYFEIIKYPLIGLNELSIYRHLPWSRDGLVCNAPNDCYIPDEQGVIYATHQRDDNSEVLYANIKREHNLAFDHAIPASSVVSKE